MKIVNYMNFVRLYDPRPMDDALSHQRHFTTTKAEVELAKECGIKSTFLLQYDALIDESYIELFRREKDDDMELGLWLEIVRPLTDKVGLPWRGEPNTAWDWHVVPGFSMAYTVEERKMLADEAMGAFHKIYGYYPKTVASWLLDTVTVAYVKEKYDVKTVAICRDQTNTDAYTLVGGYFNQAYYPSKYNVFTPAQNAENAIDVPVFRLLGPDPIHNYDSTKYHVNVEAGSCCTLEPVWYTGKTPEVVDWFFKTFYKNEDMGFSYSQIGQENSFGHSDDLITPLRMQIEKLKKYRDVQFMTMEETGRWFKETYRETPVTSVVALSDWNSDKIQSVYYDCKNYMANLFRFGEKVFIRCMYRFDETVPEHYLDTPCTTWDATYENLPLVDTLLWEDDNGILIDGSGAEFDVKREDDEKLTVFWNNCEVTFSPDGVCIKGATPTWNLAGNKAGVRVDGNKILYSYNGNTYAMTVTEGSVKQDGETVTFTGNRIFLEV